MKRRLLLLLVIVSLSFSANACDICGCGVGSYYIGILPEFNKKIFGLRYRHNTLRTHLGAGGQSTYLTTEEIYRTAELWGGWTIGKKFRVLGYIPVNFNEKQNQGTTYTKSGLGDIGVQGYYQLVDQRKTIGSKLLVHSLWLGAGLKVPTGKYDASQKDINQQTANIFQLGSGSVDFTMNAMYDLRIQDAGINLATSYKMNTVNGEDYKYGNKFNFNALVYYKFRVKDKVTIAPGAGIMHETGRHDKDHGFLVDVSGGNLTLGTLGAEVAFGKMAIGGNFQTPLKQNLANGFVRANNRLMVHVSFML